MLKVYKAENSDQLDLFINSFINNSQGWAVMQPDRANAVFPAQYVVVTDRQARLATIHILN